MWDTGFHSYYCKLTVLKKTKILKVLESFAHWNCIISIPYSLSAVVSFNLTISLP